MRIHRSYKNILVFLPNNSVRSWHECKVNDIRTGTSSMYLYIHIYIWQLCRHQWHLNISYDNLQCYQWRGDQVVKLMIIYDDDIKLKHFPRYWPFVWGIHRSRVSSPHKGQRHGALMFSLTCALIDGWENIREAGDLTHHRAHYDDFVMLFQWYVRVPTLLCPLHLRRVTKKATYCVIKTVKQLCAKSARSKRARKR